MEFINANFIESTIRDDEGINGAIFVDSILIRESELQYGDTINKIPLDTIMDENFIKCLNGLLVFNEHPSEFVNGENYNRLAGESIGSIVSSEFRKLNGDNVIYGTLRITNPKMVEEVKNRQIRGGSLGYYAGLDDDKSQRNIKPNHFCLTTHPRDEGVIIFNSKKGEQMDNINKNEVVVNKDILESFVNSIEANIVDKKVKSIVNSKVDVVDKVTFLSSVLCVKECFNSTNTQNSNSDEALSNQIKILNEKIELLEKQNTLLDKLLQTDDKPKTNNEDEPKDEPKANNEDEPKEEPKDEPKANEFDESKDESKDEPKVNNEDEGKTDDEPKVNSVPLTNSSVDNTNYQDKMVNVLSQFSI